MSAITFEHGSLIFGRQNVMGTFDADIDSDVCNRVTNANLTLYVRIRFQEINPSVGTNTHNDADGTAVPIRAWGPGEFTRWKRRFINDCQRRWSGKIWLETPRTYSRLNWPRQGSTHRPNLYCRLEMSEQTSSTGAHAVIPVVRVSGSHFFRSHMLLYSHRDLRSERLTRGSRFFTHVHEIGHLIGLDHPGTGLAGCVNGGEDVCYAAADGNDRGVMGRGSRIYDRHAQPWQKAASILTGTSENAWKVSRKRIYPRSL